VIRASIVVTDPLGLHLRPAGILCNEALKFQASVKFESGHSSGNAKSMLSVLGAQIKAGDEITFLCDGPDEKEALEAMINLVSHSFQ
jgi:phosphocarrier protein